MKYMVRKSLVWVIGYIWMPSNVLCSRCYTLREYDIENCKDEHGKVTRKSVERWVMLNTGDFSEIKDWRASLEVEGETVEFEWEHDDSEDEYLATWVA